MSDFRGLYDIRGMIESDKNFILSTFLRGVYYGSSWYNLIPKDLFMKHYKALADFLVTSPNCVVLVACLKDDPETIIGYSVLSEDAKSILWVYVKQKWRYKKVGTSLLPPDPLYAMHVTDMAVPLLRKYPNLVFNPFILT